MKAIVLAGGYATRLRPISYTVPKLLFPVLGKPMIYRTLDLLKKFGVREVVLAVNYLAEQLREAVGSNYAGISVKYSLEEHPLGTAGPIRLASKIISQKETFIVMNGDVLADIDFHAMLSHHRATRASVTDAVHEVMNPSRFGVAHLNREGMIERFVEKPRPGQDKGKLVNAGIYLIEPNVLRLIPSGRKMSLEREIFPFLAKKGKLAGFRITGYWFDIGNIADYKNGNFNLLQQAGTRAKAPKQSSSSRAFKVEMPVHIEKNARIERRARIGPFTIVGSRTVVGKDSWISGSILFDGVTVGEGCRIRDSIIASNAVVGQQAKIGPGCVISANVSISDGVRIGNNAIIHPFKEIHSDVKPSEHVL